MALRSTAMDYVDLGKRQYKASEWAEAVRSFDRAITLNQKSSETYELKSKSLLRLSIAEGKQYAISNAGPDGVSTREAAYKTAVKTVEKFGKDRWQPYYVLADILYHYKRYSKVLSYLAQVKSHPQFSRANAVQKAAIQKFAERVAHDRRYVTVRNLGRAEADAIEQDLEREAQIRRRTNYEHVLPSDIFLRIIELAKESDPRLPVRMSGVCKRWRETLINQRGVWQKLILGKGKDVVLKVRTYLDRCGGGDGANGSGLRELRISEGFDWNRADEVGRLLKPHARYIERLRLDIRPNPSTASNALLHHFHRSMASLRVLDIRACDIRPGSTIGLSLPTKRLDFDLLPEGCSTLQELSLAGVTHTSERMMQTLDPTADNEGCWTRNQAEQLANVSVLRLSHCRLGCNGVEYRHLLQYMPKIREVHLQSVLVAVLGSKQDSVINGDLRLDHLEEWRVEGSHHLLDFLPAAATLPVIKHLDHETVDPISLCRSITFSGALPGLRSLNLGKSTIPDGFIHILRDTVALEYLNLSRCSLLVKFLEDLASGAKAVPRLLPNLVALSLAGNLELRAPVLRDLVNSRLPEHDRIPVPVTIVPLKRKSPFGPSLPRSTLASPASSLASLTAPPTALAMTPPDVARLRWLNIDLCENVDSALFPALERKLGFLSRAMGVPDEDRIRGRGRWDWELDMSAECRWKLRGERLGEGEEAKCEVRPNGKGGYHIYHTCYQAPLVEEEKGWEWTSQTQRSQQSASQAKRGQSSRGGRRSGPQGRKGRLDGVQEE